MRTNFKITLLFIKKIFHSIPKSLFFPILLLIPLIIFCGLGLNGSSIGTYNEAIDGNAGTHRIFGENKWIRSDEYLAITPTVLSQVRNNFPEINYDIGTGINLGIQSNMPIGNIFSLFRPTTWLFFLTNNLEVGFAFFWWFKMYLMIVGVYFLLLELTDGNKLIAILGAITFYFTPFVQWWSNYELIGYGSIIVFAFLRLIKTPKKIEMFFMGFLFYLFSVSFALVLYPPFQIIVAWSCVFIAMGYLLNNIKLIRKDKNLIYKILFTILLVILILFTVFLFYKHYKSPIDTITNTDYPGTRSYYGGGLSFEQVFNGFYNILLQSDYNGVPLGQRNQSESSNFMLFFPPIIIFSFWNFFSKIKRKQKIDFFMLFNILWTVLLTMWTLFPFPKWFSKFSLLSMVPPFRTVIGIGFSSYILTFYYLSKKLSEKSNMLLATFISILIFFLLYILGLKFYIGNQDYFAKPVLLSVEMKILLVSIFGFLSTYLLLRKHKILFMCAILIFSFLSTFTIHPLYKGTDSIDNTNFSKTVNKYESNRNNKWIVYGDHRFAQYLIANGHSVLNGIHYYPLFEMWKIIDPSTDYYHIYNRYAHVQFANQENKPLVELLYADQIRVNMNPCDEKLKMLEVSYFLLPEKKEYSCLEYKESLDTFLRGTLYIYKRK